MMHERRRCLVGMVQVVDGQHHAAFRGGLSQQLRNGKEYDSAVHLVIGRALRAAHRRQQS